VRTALRTVIGSLTLLTQSLRTRTKSLRDWFHVTHLMITGEKRISAQRVWRHMGFGSLRNALYMYQCINAALIENDVGKLGGIVEAGDAYIGGFCGRVQRR
jgi:hypothetical protein